MKARTLKIFIIVVAMVSLINCSKEETDSTDCDSLKSKATVALAAYGLNSSTSNCEDVQDAIYNYLDNCSTVDASTVEYFTEKLTSLDCYTE